MIIFTNCEWFIRETQISGDHRSASCGHTSRSAVYWKFSLNWSHNIKDIQDGFTIPTTWPFKNQDFSFGRESIERSGRFSEIVTYEKSSLSIVSSDSAFLPVRSPAQIGRDGPTNINYPENKYLSVEATIIDQTFDCHSLRWQHLPAPW